MFAEFGQAPLCLDIDLASFEGPWQHVARFRGRAGWLTGTRVTVQSEDDLTSAVLTVACYDCETPIPTWQVQHLIECNWSNLEHCREEPPPALDDLLCEEEGALILRFQSEQNDQLRALVEQSEIAIDALEGRVARRVKLIEHQIADLRRRRRSFDIAMEHRTVIDEAIMDLEVESQTFLDRLIDDRARLRRDAELSEEMLWRQADVIIDREALFAINWNAVSLDLTEHPASPISQPRDFIPGLARRWREDEDGAAAVVKKLNAKLGPLSSKVITPPPRPVIPTTTADEPHQSAIEKWRAFKASEPIGAARLTRDIRVMETLRNKNIRDATRFMRGSKPHTKRLAQIEKIEADIASLKHRLAGLRDPSKAEQ